MIPWNQSILKADFKIWLVFRLISFTMETQLILREVVIVVCGLGAPVKLFPLIQIDERNRSSRMVSIRTIIYRKLFFTGKTMNNKLCSARISFKLYGPSNLW